ncbi:MAG: amidohydrolase [Saprospiraceae bacterium]|nr:amidohydrolase [Saprospiraceae bacterium]
MKKQFYFLCFLALGLVSTAEAQQKEALKNEAIKDLDGKYADYKNIAMQIWNHAELGYKEVESSKLHQKTLKDNGFTIQAGVADIPTAFVATFGEGKPVIGILAEYDALPGLSQAAEPVKKPIAGKAGGHGCGHHLFGTASVASAIELKNLMVKNKLKGTIKLYGTPAEEGGSGKVYMVRAGLFDGVDVVIHWHPGATNEANPSSALANISAKFRFRGQSAHAAGAPDRGRSALDGVEAMDNMVNMMREHVPQESRIHYVITEGGKAPNVVPDFAEVYYYARHPRRDVVKDLFDRIVKCANGAAMGTDTKVEYEIIGGTHEILPVPVLAQAMHANLTKVGGVNYTAEEIAFGQKLQESFPAKNRPNIMDASKIEPYKDESYRTGGGSTDVGDVSFAVPTVGLRTATWIPGTPAHSWQAVACGGTDIGGKGMMVAAKTMTLMGLDLLMDKSLIDKATAEWKAARGSDFKYAPLLGDRKPALNYRDSANGNSE